MEFEPSKEDLKELRKWLQKMPHIVQHYDDKFLAAFVRASKGSLQRTKIVLENFNALGMRYPEFFGTLDPFHPPLQEGLSVWQIFPLPEKTPNDCVVIWSRLNSENHDPLKSHAHEYFRCLLLTFYIYIWENNFGSGQIKLVFDNKGVTLGHCREMTPMFTKKVITMADCGFPVRIKSANAYNVPSIIEHLCKLFKVFAKKKLADRVNVYSTIDKLSEEIPQKMLPKEYGGCGESVFKLHDNWRKKMESYRERFLKEERLMRELDHLRPKTNEEDEMTGTFKQLNVD